MHHHHDHDHTSHAPASFGRAFLIGIALNLFFIVAEVLYGLKANSVALLADAGHNVSDVLGLIMAWGATMLAQRKPTSRFTYGLQGSSIVASLANAALLLLATGGIAWEALWRLSQPESVGEATVMIVAAIGIVINGATALLFMKGSRDDLNIRGAFLHMTADAAISLGVVLSGALMLATGWLWLDPAVSIAIAFVIVWGTWGLLKDSVALSLHAVPPHIDPAQVRDYLCMAAGVSQVHDLHIWAMSTTEVALSAHLLIPGGHPGDAFLRQMAHELDHRFHIGHSTLQIELGDGADSCALSPEHVV